MHTKKLTERPIVRNGWRGWSFADTGKPAINVGPDGTLFLTASQQVAEQRRIDRAHHRPTHEELEHQSEAGISAADAARDRKNRLARERRAAAKLKGEA